MELTEKSGLVESVVGEERERKRDRGVVSGLLFIRVLGRDGTLLSQRPAR
jgi:hypothetical protein